LRSDSFDPLLKIRLSSKVPLRRFLWNCVWWGFELPGQFYIKYVIYTGYVQDTATRIRKLLPNSQPKPLCWHVLDYFGGLTNKGDFPAQSSTREDIGV